MIGIVDKFSDFISFRSAEAIENRRAAGATQNTAEEKTHMHNQNYRIAKTMWQYAKSVNNDGTQRVTLKCQRCGGLARGKVPQTRPSEAVKTHLAPTVSLVSHRVAVS